MKANSPIVKHLVLVGGGHSHLHVLRNFAMRPMPGLAITVISRDVLTPYSGCLPGYLAGIYSLEEMHIDLRPLAQFAGARLIQSEISEIDLDSRKIIFSGRPDIPFDILSINTGSQPNADRIRGATTYATPIKPINDFISQWERWREEAIPRLQNDEAFNFVIVGGGPTSVELAFATRQRFCKELKQDVRNPNGLKITLISADPELLGLHNSRVRQFTTRELQNRHIQLRLDCPVVEFQADSVVCDNDEVVAADAIVYATGASLPAWPFQCGLEKSQDGFISIKDTLQTTTHEFVFAVGDVATVVNEPRPKSGVYAVRQGKVLADNLRRYATGKALRSYFPQRRALALMSMGDGRAIASRGDLFLKGRSMWSLKHQIDSRFVKKYSELPEMPADLALEPGLVDAETANRLRQHAMRCAGCGAKLAADVLHEVLAELPAHRDSTILTSATGIEDAARIQLPDGRLLLQSVDYLRSFVHDPWLFARIATMHCLSDIYAMGVYPHSALAIVGVPHADKRYSRQLMKELMGGSSEVLAAEQCVLIGGHSAESAELQFGLCVNGFAENERLLGKDTARENDIIILTKPLGTGTLLAADMRCKASHVWMKYALDTMLQSNRDAVDLIVSHGANACTDVTGFGLAGHLIEMMDASRVNAELMLEDIAALPGALECLENGIFSTLHEDNRQVAARLDDGARHIDSPQFELLFDPQTAGGLLFTLPATNANACLEALIAVGYDHARIIGRIVLAESDHPGIALIRNLNESYPEAAV